MTRYRSFPYLVLLFGVLVAATSSILVRLAQNSGAPSLVIATWRLIFASIILTPLAWARRNQELCRLQHRDIKLGIVAGANA